MKHTLLLIVSILMAGAAYSQVKLGSNAGAPHSSTVLDLESTTRGMLLPRMTSVQRSAISSPAAGLMVYNTTLSCTEVYNGTQWGCLDYVLTPSLPSLGGSLSTSNGTDPFSANTTCTTAVISAQHTSSTCSGSVTTPQGNTYNVVLINGLCWMQTNLKDTPSNYAYNNTWLNNANYGPDTARYGYNNTSFTSGSAGFQATEPAAGEGMLYQWKAAMNGSTVERAQGACPSGWHIPSDCEWMYMEHSLGMSVANQNSGGTRNSGSVGSQLSTLTSGGTNSAQWFGLMAGWRINNGTGQFQQRGSQVYFISSTIASLVLYSHWSRRLLTSASGVQRTNLPVAIACSVRCLKD